jgi:dihydroorotate dehydrogenase
MSLTGVAFPLLKPILHRLDAETAHRLTIAMLNLTGRARAPRSSALAVDCFGLSFPNPLGLAAGFDKNGEAADALLGLGFGFVEVGTVTPKPQAGNDRPRLFRLSEDEAVINRMGFNNLGAGIVRRRLEQRRERGGIIGINIGANKESADRLGDYGKGVKAFADLASYLVVNVSSPNTPGLRDLQSREMLRTLLEHIVEARGTSATPLLLKIAPDLGDGELEDIAEVCSGRLIDGIIVSNTTVSRPHLESPLAREAGGLSGKPLFDLSTRVLARLFLLTQGGVRLIGVGGIRNAETAWTKFAAGASLVQLYTALVYRGPLLIPEILDGLADKLASSGFTSIAAAAGHRAKVLAYHGLAGT